LSGCSSQVILSTDGLVEDGDTENEDKNSNKVSIVPGLGVDIATIDLTNLGCEGGSGDIVSDPTENGEVIKPGCLTFSLATTIPPPSTNKQNHQVHQPNSSRRGPGRPRREDTEVDPPIGKVLTIRDTCKVSLQDMYHIIFSMNNIASLDNYKTIFVHNHHGD
jgi:hypothetical protein